MKQSRTHTRAHRIRPYLIAAATAALLGATGTTPADADTGTTADFHLSVNAQGLSVPFHTVRDSTGNWSPWDQPANNFTTATSVPTSATQAEGGGKMYYLAERPGNGAPGLDNQPADEYEFGIWDIATAHWTVPLSPTYWIARIDKDTGNLFTQKLVGSAVIGGQLRIFALDDFGNINMNTYVGNGQGVQGNDWLGWGVDAPVLMSGLRGITDAAVATTNGTDLQVAAIANGKVYHSLCAGLATGCTAVGDVYGATRSNPGVANHIAVAGVNGTLQVVVTTDNGASLYHAVRSANGSWTTFGNVEAATKSAPGTITSIAMAPSGGSSTSDVMELAALNSTGTIYHTIRSTSGSWTAMQSVQPNVPGSNPFAGHQPSFLVASGE
ncbi:hypothetical protein ACEZDB_12260 [Streptacidiphilus sp. N1-3]|uniref:Uncharacterized protein n=1 Tax=Streptacidiphilus alkalitolerans TaxID=3342712 RepID=A0ABV6WZJ3_9ACTN